LRCGEPREPLDPFSVGAGPLLLVVGVDSRQRFGAAAGRAIWPLREAGRHRREEQAGQTGRGPRSETISEALTPPVICPVFARDHGTVSGCLAKSSEPRRPLVCAAYPSLRQVAMITLASAEFLDPPKISDRTARGSGGYRESENPISPCWH
jgi:hypothetical protein